MMEPMEMAEDRAEAKPTRDDGGAAFPCPGQYVDENICPRELVACQDGMTLRDWFAGQALIGLMSNPETSPESPGQLAHAAGRLYEMADAMLKARQK